MASVPLGGGPGADAAPGAGGLVINIGTAFLYAPCSGAPGKPTAAVCCFRNTGALFWATDAPPGPAPVSPAVVTCAGTMDTNMNAYFAFSNGAVQGYGLGSGALRWPTGVPVANVTGGAAAAFTSIAYSKGALYVVEAGARLLYAVDAEPGAPGSVKWTMPLYSPYAQPAVAPPDGHLFVVAVTPDGTQGILLRVRPFRRRACLRRASPTHSPPHRPTPLPGPGQRLGHRRQVRRAHGLAPRHRDGRGRAGPHLRGGGRP